MLPASAQTPAPAAVPASTGVPAANTHTPATTSAPAAPFPAAEGTAASSDSTRAPVGTSSSLWRSASGSRSKGSDAIQRSKDLLKAQRQVDNQNFLAEVAQYFEEREEKIQDWKRRYPSKFEKDIRRLLSNESAFATKRKPTLYNAFLHDVSLRNKSDGKTF